ncbi:hypothetical protein Hanom_Chr15g01402771 [Helianthus anomalus]
MGYIYRERHVKCRTPPPQPLHRPTTAMSELRGHCTSPPYQLKTVMIADWNTRFCDQTTPLPPPTYLCPTIRG